MQKLKRAFTIVELVIVIAVVAVLSAVLVPTFVNVFKNAQNTADSSNISGANTIIFSESALGEEVNGVEEVEDLLTQNGLNLSTLKPQNEQAFFAWDNNSKQLVCIDKDANLLYSSKSFDVNKAELWVIISLPDEFLNIPQGANCYLTKAAQGEFKVAEGAAYSKDLIISSGANVTLSGNISGKIFVNDGASVNQNSSLNLYYPLIIQIATGGTLTPNYALANGNFAKIGDQISISYTLDEGYNLSNISCDGATISQSGESYSFIMPASKVTLLPSFTKSSSLSTQQIGGVTYTLQSFGEEYYYEVTSANTENINTTQTNGFLILEEEIEYNGAVYPVNSIANLALENIGVSGIVVSKNTTSIGYWAFANNTELEKVVFLADNVSVSNNSEDGVPETTYPFFGCVNEQLTLYYTAITDVSNTKIENGWRINSIYEGTQFNNATYSYIAEDKLITKNWTWNNNDYCIELNDNGSTDDDDNTGSTPDEPTTPEEPQMYTVTINFVVTSTIDPRSLYVDDSVVLEDINNKTYEELKGYIEDVVTLTLIDNRRALSIAIGEQTYLIKTKAANNSNCDKLTVTYGDFILDTSNEPYSITPNGNVTITINC